MSPIQKNNGVPPKYNALGSLVIGMPGGLRFFYGCTAFVHQVYGFPPDPLHVQTMRTDPRVRISYGRSAAWRRHVSMKPTTQWAHRCHMGEAFIAEEILSKTEDRTAIFGVRYSPPIFMAADPLFSSTASQLYRLCSGDFRVHAVCISCRISDLFAPLGVGEGRVGYHTVTVLDLATISRRDLTRRSMRD